MGSAEAVVTADGTRLYVCEQGPSEAPTVVLVHGWTLDCRVWQPVAQRLLAGPAPVRVVCYDHRGHGRSDPAGPQNATLEQLADDLAELLCRRVPAGPVVLAGHSMGGMTIMALAERHPELTAARVAGVAFVATSCGELAAVTLGLPGPAGRLVRGGERLLGRSRRFRSRPTFARRPALVRPGLRWLLFGEHPRRSDVDLTVRCVADCRPGTVVDFRPAFDEHDRRQALAAFEGNPAAVLGGGRDRLCPPSHARVIAAELPGARFSLLPGAGHMLPLERAEHVADRIGELLNAASRAA